MMGGSNEESTAQYWKCSIRQGTRYLEIPAMGGRQATITNTRHEAGIADQSSSVEVSKHADAEETKAQIGRAHV